ncbi:helix-turn-helix transcriptional regulator [Streptomyces inhibens]|nr:helix-turn-helix transcriptional regulator [Streptomyces inhibens]
MRGFRHTAGMTLEELAEASGVSARAIGDMERGHSRGTPDACHSGGRSRPSRRRCAASSIISKPTSSASAAVT